MSKIMFRRKDLLGSNPSKSKAMRALLKDENIADVLDKRAEIRQFRDELKKYATNDRYVTEDEVRAALAELKIGRGDSLSRNEVRKLRKAMDVGGSIDVSDLAQDSKLRKHKGGGLDLDTNRASSSRRSPLRGLPF